MISTRRQTSQISDLYLSWVTWVVFVFMGGVSCLPARADYQSSENANLSDTGEKPYYARFREVLREAYVPSVYIEEAVKRLKVTNKSLPPLKYIRKNASWLRTHGVEDSNYVIAVNPSILGAPSTEQWDERVDWMRRMGMKKVAFVIEKYPWILTDPIPELLKKFDWLKRERGLSLSKIEAKPGVLEEEIPERERARLENPPVRKLPEVELEPPVRYSKGLNAREAIPVRRALIAEGMSAEWTERVVMTLGLPPSEKLIHQNIQWLKREGFSNIGEAIASSPGFLFIGKTEALDAQVAWFQKRGFVHVVPMLNKNLDLLTTPLATLSTRLRVLTQDQGFTVRDLEAAPKLLLKRAAPQMKEASNAEKRVTPEFEAGRPAEAPEVNKELKQKELIEYWGFSTADLEREPQLLSLPYDHLRSVRKFFGELVEAAGGKEFDPLSLRVPERKYVLVTTPEAVMRGLLKSGALAAEPADLKFISDMEKQNLKKLFKSRELFRPIETRFPKISQVRIFLDQLAVRAGRAPLNSQKLSPSQAAFLSEEFAPEILLSHFKSTGVISQDRKSFESLSDAEWDRLVLIYRNDDLGEFLISSPKLSLEARSKLRCVIDYARLHLTSRP